MRLPLPRRFGRNLFAAVLGVGLLTSCLGEDTSQNAQLVADAEAELQAGKDFLQQGLYEAAKVKLEPLVSEGTDFNAALQNDVQTLDEARMAFVLANTFNQLNIWVNTLGQIFGLVGPLLGEDSGLSLSPDYQALAYAMEDGFYAADEFQAQAGGGLSSPINGFLTSFIQFFEENLKHLDAIKQNPDFQLEFQTLPFRIGNTDIMNMGGEYDLGEVYFLNSLFRLINGSLTFVYAIDLTITLPRGDVINQLVDKVSGLSTTDDPFGDVLNIIGVLLYDQRALLGLSSADDMQEAGFLFEEAFTDFLRGIEFMQAEASGGDPDQSDDLLGYFPGDGQDPDYLELHMEFNPQPVPGVDTTKLSNLQVELADNIINSIDNIKEAFAGTPGARISWARDIVPLISLAAVTLLQTGAVDGLIQAGIDSAGLDESTSGSINSILNSDIIDASLVEGVILSFIPDVLEFDVGTYFQSPAAPRDFLPYWTTPTTSTVTQDADGTPLQEPREENNYDVVTLLVEYECLDGNDNPFDAPETEGGAFDIFCNSSDIADRDHFWEGVTGVADRYAGQLTMEELSVPEVQGGHGELVANLREMGPGPGPNGQNLSANQLSSYVPNSEELGVRRDGIASPFFYMAFRDPSFGGMLWIKIDSNSVKSSTASDEMELWMDGNFHPATNRTLNALVHGLFADILETVGF